MSFEGHYQILCKNGHSRGCDCYEEPNFDGPETEEIEGTVYSTPLWRCSCGETAAWWNLVDVTNGSFCTECDGSGCKCCDNGRIDRHVELEEDKPAKTQRCNLGCDHVIEEQTYKIPEGKGHKV